MKPNDKQVPGNAIKRAGLLISAVLLVAAPGHALQETSIEAQRFTFEFDPATPNAGWRIDQLTGAVSYCLAEGIEVPPRCSPWSGPGASLSTSFSGPTPPGPRDGLSSTSDTTEFGCVFDTAEESAPVSLEDYYSRVEGISGTTLRARLNEIVSEDAVRLTYSEVWDALAVTDENPCNPGYVVLLYTGRSHPIELRNRGGRGQQDNWSREHVWPKSHGFRAAGMAPYTDIHHLRPADTSVNTSRSNRDFQNGGEPEGEAPDTFRTSTTWEPRDAVKGDVARMMFFLVIRYEGQGNLPDLELLNRETRSDEPHLGFLCTLYEWHEQDPVSLWEQRRNNLIHGIQGNRNPFIDEPLWVGEIWSDYCR